MIPYPLMVAVETCIRGPERIKRHCLYILKIRHFFEFRFLCVHLADSMSVGSYWCRTLFPAVIILSLLMESHFSSSTRSGIITSPPLAPCSDFSSFQSPAIRVGGSGCEVTDWTADSTTTCLLAHGVDDSLDLVVSVNSKDSSGNLRQNTGTLANGFRYDGPVLLGTVDTISYECNGTTSTSPCSQATCTLPWKWNDTEYPAAPCGTGGEIAVIYDPVYPGRANFPAFTQGVEFTVKGLNFGSHDTSVLLTVAQSSSTPSVWMSDSSVLAIAAFGAATNWTVSFFRFRQNLLDFEAQITQYLSYDEPASSEANQQNSTGVGNTAFNYDQIFLGESFVPFDTTPFVRIDGTACQSSTWISDSTISCLTRSGVGSTQPILGTVVQQYFTTSRANSYDCPEFSSLQRQNFAVIVIPTVNMTLISLWTSTAIAQTSYSSMIRMRTSVIESTVWISSSSIQCLTSSAKGSTAMVVLTMGKKGASLTESTSFDSLATSNTTLNGTANSLFNTPPLAHLITYLFIGKNLGIADFTPKGNFGQTPSEYSRWFSDTSLQGKVPVGITLAHLLKAVTSEAKVNTFLLTFSFDLIQLVPNKTIWNPGNPVNFPATGGTPVTVEGVNFGNVDATGKGRIHAGIDGTTATASSCYATIWYATTSIVCLAPTAVRGTAAVSMTVVLTQSTLTTALTYDLSALSGQASSNVLSDLGLAPARATIAGKNFGRFEDSFRLMASGTVSEVLLWLSDTLVICNYARGIGGSGYILLSVGERKSHTMTDLTSYDSPTLKAQPAASNGTQVRNGCATGSRIIFLTGQGFGKADLREGAYSIISRLGATAPEFTIWISESAVSSKTPALRAQSNRLLLTLGISMATITSPFSFDEPYASSLHPVNAFVSSQLNSQLILNVSAVNLGHQDISPKLNLGHSTAAYSKWFSDTSLRCLEILPGVGRSQILVVTGMLQSGTVTKAISFDALQANAPFGINVPATGSSSISVSGVQMALNAYSPFLRIGHTGSTTTSWFSYSSVQALASWGIDTNSSVRVTMQEYVNSASSLFSYDEYDSLSSSHLQNSPSTGSASFTVSGGGFGLAAVTGKLRFFSTVCKSTSWLSDSSMACKIFSATEKSRDVLITFSNYHVQTSTSFFSFDMLSISRLKRQNAASTGSISLSIAGSSLASTSTSLQMRTLSTSCLTSNWFADTSVTCKSSQQIRASTAISLTVGDQAGSQTAALSVDSPAARTASSGNSIGTGSMSLTLAGKHFNLNAGSINARLSSSGSESTYWISDTSLWMKACSGLSSTKRIQVTAGKRMSSTSSAISYLSGAISTSLPANSKSTSIKVDSLLSGRFLSLVSFSPRMGVEGSKAPASVWISDTAISSRCPSGISKSRSIVLSSSLPGTATLFLTYDKAALSSSTRSNQATTGSVQVSLAASGFAIASLSISGTAGRSCGENSMWISDSSMTVKAAAGQKPTRMMIVTVGAQLATSTEFLTYHTIALSRFSDRSDCQSKLNALKLTNYSKWTEIVGPFVLPGNSLSSPDPNLISRACYFPSPNVNMALTAFGSVTVMGASFGNTDLCCGIRIGFSSGARSLWISDTCMQGLLTLGAISSNSLLATQLDRIRDVTISAAFTFDDSIISSTSPYNDQKKSPANSISIYGKNFGCYVTSSTARLLQTEFDATNWQSDSSIQSMRGDRGNRPSSTFSATCGEMISSTTEMYSYNIPIASNMHQSNQPPLDSIQTFSYLSSQAFETDVKGINFAFFDATSRTVIAPSQIEATFWISDTLVTAIASRGALKHSRQSFVTAGNKVGSQSASFTFDSVLVQKTPNVNAAVTGSVSFTIVGGGVGLTGSTVRIRYGQTRAENSRWVSSSSCLCSASDGALKTRKVMITVGEQLGSGTDVISFQQPSIQTSKAGQTFNQTSTRINLLTTGSSSVTLHGCGFSSSSSSTSVRVLNSAAESSSWFADTALRCRSSGGRMGTTRALVTIGAQVGTATHVSSHDMGQLTRIKPTNSLSTGSLSITLKGANFDLGSQSVKARQGKSTGESCSWVSDTGLNLKSTSGYHSSTKILATIGGKIGSTTQLLSYSNPRVSTVRSTWLIQGINITEKNEAVRRNNSLHYGTAVVSLSSDFCDADPTSMIPLDGSNIVCNPNIFNNSLDESNNSATSSKHTTLHYSKQALISFRAYVIRDMWIETKQPSWIVIDAEGCKPGDPVQVCLHDYSGLENLTSTAALFINAVPCNTTKWFSPTSVQCALKPSEIWPSAISLDISFGTAVNPFVYGLPYETANTPADASMIVLVSGTGFEEKSNTPGGRTVLSNSEATLWAADTMLSMKVAQFIGSTKRFMITLGKNLGSSSETLSLNIPTILSVLSVNESSTGNYLISMSGSGFGSFNQSDYTSASRVGSTACEITEWIADSQIYCTVSWGLQATLRLLHTLGMRTGTLSEAFSFERPMLSSLIPTNSPATGRCDILTWFFSFSL